MADISLVVVALVSTGATLTTTVIPYITRLRGARQKFKRLQTEILVLQDVVYECHEALDRAEAPPHVRESLIACFDEGQEVVALAERTSRGLEDRKRILLTVPRLMFREDELTKTAAIFRERVALLRDMCSEIRMRAQFVESSAAMARLADLSEKSIIDAREDFESLRTAMAAMRADEVNMATGAGWEHFRRSVESLGDDEANDARSEHSSHGHDLEPTSLSDTVATKRKGPSVRQELQVLRRQRRAIRKQFSSLEASNYVVDATVLVENPLKARGQRFKHVSAELTEYYPGRVKLDTGSEADFVSLGYLLQAGFTQDALQSIPVAQQTQVEGIDGAKYTPKFEVELKWFRQGEALTNTGRFLVVDQAPFDILLSSRRFAKEAARQLVSLPLVRPRKPRAVIDREIQEEKKRIEASKEMEEKEYQAELMRRRTMGRISTMNTTADQNDVELGSLDPNPSTIN